MCTLAAKVFTHRSCCLSHTGEGTVGITTFPFCLALVRAHWEGWVQFRAPHDNKDMTELQQALRRTPQVSRQMEHRTYKMQLAQVADADGLSSKVHSDRKRCNDHKQQNIEK